MQSLPLKKVLTAISTYQWSSKNFCNPAQELTLQSGCACILTSSSSKSLFQPWACKPGGHWRSVRNLIFLPHFSCFLVIFTKLAFHQALTASHVLSYHLHLFFKVLSWLQLYFPVACNNFCKAIYLGKFSQSFFSFSNLHPIDASSSASSFLDAWIFTGA